MLHRDKRRVLLFVAVEYKFSSSGRNYVHHRINRQERMPVVNRCMGEQGMTYEKSGLYIDEAHLESFAENFARGLKIDGGSGKSEAAALPAGTAGTA